MKPIDIAPTDLATVQSILSQHVPSLEARAFGSRVSWNARSTSDLDLALLTTVPLDFTLKADLREAFAQSALPFRVDIVDWAATSEDFREVIEQEYVVLQDRRKIDFKNNDAWREIPLKDIAEIIMGQSPPSSTYNALGSGLPFFQGVKDFGYRHPTPRVYCSVPSRIAKPGDILFSVRAPIGRVNIADRKCATGRGLAIVKPFDSSEARFLEFVLKNMAFQWEELEAGGSVFGNATKKDLERLSILWPCHKQERKTIAHILGTLDDKIALNHQMNQTLEEMARALFKSWFVNFDPVHAKMEKRWLAGQPFLDWFSEFYHLFPKKFVNSDTGNIPEGWKVGKLSDISKLLKRRISPSDLDLRTPYIGLEHMPKRSIALANWEKASKVKSSKSGFRKGDVLFGKLRPYFHKVGISPIDGICSTDILVLAPVSRSWSAFLLLCVSDSKFIRYVTQSTTGTRMPRTDWKKMQLYKIYLPTKDVIEAFQNITQVLIDQIVINIHEIKMLTDLRNTLLPKILSGQVRSHSNM